MSTLALAVQLYGPHREDGAKALLSLISELAEGLQVQATLHPVPPDGWVDVELSGEDAEVAEALITRNVGLRPRSLGELAVSQRLKGRVFGRDSEGGLQIDVGLTQPKPIQLSVPAWVLRAQLPYGRRVNASQLAQLWCLHEHLPLELWLTQSGDPERSLEAELSERQVGVFTEWVESGLDRVIAVGATLRKVRSALKASRHLMDAARLDRLGLLEVSVLCKLGTDAPGIIHDVGRHLPGVSLYSFQPGRILKLERRLERGVSSEAQR
ncbi:MAG: DUF2110 family protein [Candidatus Bathyarchaeia archaeon]